MRRIIIYTAVLFLLVRCTKDNSTKDIFFQAKGILTGPDNTLCACCGGLVLKIDGDPKDYRVDDLGTYTGGENRTHYYPKIVKFNYETLFTCGTTTHIRITEWTDRL